MSSRGDSKSKGKEVSQGLSENTLDDADEDSDVNQQSHGARKQNKKFFDSLDIDHQAIPNDLVSQIIGKLPIKSAIRFCSVSPNWSRVICRDIAYSWSQASKKPRILLTAIGDYRMPHNRVYYSVCQNSHPQGWELEKAKLPGFERSLLYLCKPVRGSTISYERRGEAAICNPSWGIFRPLPDLRVTGLKKYNTTLFHLGYDDQMGIFKVLCVGSSPPKPFQFRVLSIVDQPWTWRIIGGNTNWDSVNYRRIPGAGYSGVFVNRKIYFQAGVSALICFDVISEELGRITVPEGVQIKANSLMLVNNKLGFVDTLSIWIFEEETWVRLQYSIPSELPPSNKCLGTIAQDVFVFISSVWFDDPLTVFRYHASTQLLDVMQFDDPVGKWWGCSPNIKAFIDYIDSPYPDYYGRMPQAIPERRLEEKGVGIPLLQFLLARYSAATVDCPGSPKSVRIVVVGEKGTGKSSLIVAAASHSLPPIVPHVLPDTKLHLELPVTIVDTSSRPEDRNTVAKELGNADAVVLTFECERPETLERLSTYWLPRLRRLEVEVPIIVAGCKLDLRDDNNPVSLEQVMSPIMHEFREIETFIECSALKQLQAQEVFCYAQERALHPTGPLFDQESQSLKPRCVIALKRIFILCDRDRDGALSEAELNDFQVKCFDAPLQPSEFEGFMRAVQEKLPVGVNERGLTVTGFLFLHEFSIEKGRLDTTWTVLRKFGYNNDIRLADELCPPSLFKRAPDQSVELTDVAIEFLKGMYVLFDDDGDNNLTPQEIDDLFSTAPESPWTEAPYVDAAEKTAVGGLSSDAFLSLWSLMTTLEPARSVKLLIYIGFSGEPSSAIRLTRRRRLDRKNQRCERKVFQCFVFGPNNAGKSAVLNCFLGRSHADNPGSTAYAANMVDESGGSKKTLVMREIPEDGAKGIFSSKESLAACDIALFVYDSSDESSRKRATELLVEAATHGEATGHEVPCLMVSARGDLDSFPISIQESTWVTQDMGIEPPVSISFKLGDFSYFFRKILTAAQHPHLSIPETEAGKAVKRFNRLINLVSIGAAAVVFGLVAAARKR
ncbi:hypothetical protein IGI04_001637 [Brassica rapa subsp. trilocularis]|uniref:Mitochondrial Rho GTPase n=1 Tax=Brassica rapa subsp. trilocularis TaxID=1813537 RepID=A0ABQ7NVF2_BRACM|nr:hypothetical protein IGI04_001637 [Brassica rapa subsp. trilocularis]